MVIWIVPFGLIAAFAMCAFGGIHTFILWLDHHFLLTSAVLCVISFLLSCLFAPQKKWSEKMGNALWGTANTSFLLLPMLACLKYALTEYRKIRGFAALFALPMLAIELTFYLLLTGVPIILCWTLLQSFLRKSKLIERNIFLSSAIIAITGSLLTVGTERALRTVVAVLS